MNIAVLALGLLVLLMMAVTVYGALMATSLKEKMDPQVASAIFIVLGGMTFISFLLWALVHKLIPSPIPL
jgi:hypothetical protein